MPPNTWKREIEQRIDELENRTVHQERQMRDLRGLALHVFRRLERVESWASRENRRPFQSRYAPYIGPQDVCAREQQRRQRVNGAIVADRQQQQQQQQHACRCTICLRHRRVEDRLANGEAAVSAQRQQIQAEQNHLEAGTSRNNNARNNNSRSNAGPSHSRDERANNNDNNNNGNFSSDEQFDPCGCHQWQCGACEEARRMNRLRSRTGRPHGPRTASEGLMLRDRREALAEQQQQQQQQQQNVPEPALQPVADPWADLPFVLRWSEECVACLGAPARCYAPCGHVSLCVGCAGQLVLRAPVGRLAECPLCRRASGYFKIVGNDLDV
uniref:RING-type domain-containing protein n=1 Tax=Globodera pallida TaxID=36090 RepID=A0A183C8E5_GLOPA